MESFAARLLNYEILERHEVVYLCEYVINIMICEPNIPHVGSPVVVVGDIHGQFADLQTMLKIRGPPGDVSYVFMGDYVDRGENSLEAIMLLLVYKAMHPDKVVLIRGNHEQVSINKMYGFYDECAGKYGDSTVWRTINDVFEHFNIACIIDGSYLCIHGGISPRVTICRLEYTDRFEEVGEDSILTDIFWSDPFYKAGAGPNPRGSGFLFGEDVLKQFLMYNGLDMVIRSHQLAIEGYKWDFGRLCLTVWSAPDYMGKCSNPGAVLIVEKGIPITSGSLKLFKKTRKG
ncbi:serine/threonine-protein phosphatase 4 catalytic subunit [Pancytospora epiphaga]|nr:serine/threonine-protein phosphatase 4 catalytic subunit [Pancytospora epiphaga]